MGKQNQYDHSIRVPLIMAGPGVPAGVDVDALVYQSSIFPTLCELLGIEPPATVEMPSLVPLLTGAADRLYENVFGAYRDYQRMVRTRTHKLIAYPEQRRHQLFDVANDPWERFDLSDDPAEEDRTRDLRSELRAWQRRVEDPLDIDPAFEPGPA